MSTNAGEPTPTPTGADRLGQLVSGRYRIEKMLGEGGMGAVYLAEHTHMRKRVALKLLHAEMSENAEVLARFRREAEAAARVEHPNVAAATDFGQLEDGSFFLVLEYIEGTSLRDALMGGGLGPRRSLHVARQVAGALERAHALGIVHRDLKPENVMLVRKGDDPDFVKVLDFGIAKLESHGTRDGSQPLTRFGAIIGTPEYMAPEQALGETVGPACDLYALGIILYEMLTGVHPFDANDRIAVLSMHIVAPVPAMAERNANIMVPPPVETLVKRLLEKEASARPASARALIELIDQAASESGVDMRSASGRPAPSESAVTGPLSAAQWRSDDSLAKTVYPMPTPFAPTALPSASTSPAPNVVARFQKLPPRAQLGIAAAIPLLLIVLVVGMLSARRGPPAEHADAGAASAAATATSFWRPSQASPEKLQAASAAGVSALQALAASFPDDLAVLKAYARALAKAGRAAEMLKLATTIAQKDKSAIDDGLVDGVELAAQQPDTADEAFALLEGPFGAKGIDGLWDLSSTKGVPLATQRRAAKSLALPDVRANASPAAAVLIDLKAAKTCGDRKELLERIGEHGDSRILPSLKAMKNPRGCGVFGLGDCWPCLRRGDALKDAITAVESRAAQ